MLRLLIFAPCEKVIIAEGGQSSVIGIVEMVRVVIGNDPLPANALIPFKWSFLTLWYREQDVEEPIQYQEQIRLIRPDGTEAGITGDAEFEVNNAFRNFRQHGDVPVLPAGIQGQYLLKLFLRRVGNEQWEEKGAFPIVIEHILQQPAERQVNAE